MSRFWSALAVLVGLGFAPVSAQAMPTLQLYIEGGTYNTGTDSWEFSGPTAQVWVIGNTQQFAGGISDVTLAVAYPSTDAQPNVTLSGSSTGGYGGFTDPSVAADPTLLGTYTGGGTPSGFNAPHGIYNHDAADWQEFALGDMTLADSPIADFQLDLPSPSNQLGMINVYSLDVSGVSSLHLDVWGTVVTRNGRETVRNAPFSHDADFHATTVPELDAESGAAAIALVIAAALIL